jgi:hypothetical protein
MGVTNRSLDVSEKNRNVGANYGLTATSLVLNVAMIPYPCTLQAARVAAKGISGTPTVLLKVDRFIVGAGSTVISGGATTLTMQAVGTSGIQTVVLAAAGSSFLSLQQGDVVTATTGGSNSAVDDLSISLVIQAIQDIKTSFGV